MPPIHRPRQTAHLIREQLGAGPVSSADVLALGVTPGQLRAAVSAGALRRLRRGVLQVTVDDGATPLSDSTSPMRDRAIAVLQAKDDDAWLSHASAGELWQLPRPRPRAEERNVWVTAPRRHGDIEEHVHLRLGRVAPADRATVDGIRCTGLARTAIDMARFRTLPEALVVLDAALQRIDRTELWASLDRHPMVYGRRGLREAIGEADPRSESPLESASRGLMLVARLPRPQLQRIVWLEGATYRLDFLFDDRKVVGEADGWGKLQSVEDLRAEKNREDALRRAGFTVVRWTSDEVWRRPNVMVSRLRAPLTS
jgi:very-short-patch-repair endonuclease